MQAGPEHGGSDPSSDVDSDAILHINIRAKRRHSRESATSSFPRKILWSLSSGSNPWGNEFLSILEQGEGGAQHFAGEDDMHGGGGQGFGALEGDVITPNLGTRGGHGSRDQQAAPLGMTALGQAASASMLAGFIGARIQTQ